MKLFDWNDLNEFIVENTSIGRLERPGSLKPEN